MKKNIFYGLMPAVAFLLSGASFASPYTSGYDPGDPSPFALTVWSPDVPAVIKPDSFDTVTAMAGTSYNDNKSNTDNYMAAHSNTERTSVGLIYFKSNVDLDRTVIACGFESTPIETPTKVPV